ncbi:MAG: MASE1 domain-containing protein, partial [Leptospiraceae bacterium]|nr:MASE1 domain-containing protein [Leptospiraceae bacterium]
MKSNIQNLSPIKFLLIFLGYYITGKIGLMVPSLGENVSLIWLPTGIAIAGLYKFGFKYFPAVFFAAFLINFSVGSGVFLSSIISIGNTLAPSVAVYLMKKVKFDVFFKRKKEIRNFLSIISISMLISSLNGSLQLFSESKIEASEIFESTLLWWLGDTVGAFIAGVPLLTFSKRVWISDFKEEKKYEKLILLASLLIMGLLIFGFPPFLNSHIPALLFLPLVLLTWISL